MNSTTNPTGTLIHSKNLSSRNTASIQQLTGLSDEDLFFMKVDTGVKFLELQCRNDAYGIQQMKDNAFFWSWWINLWHQRDDAFVIRYGTKFASSSYHTNTCRYMTWNNLGLLYKDCNRRILDEGYSLVINQMHQQRQHQRV